MKTRKINIKNGEVLAICIDGQTEIFLMRSDELETIFATHKAVNYSVDQTPTAKVKIERRLEADAE